MEKISQYLNVNAKGYEVDKHMTWIYPDQETAPSGKTLSLLTIGNIQTIGIWESDGRYKGWQHLFSSKNDNHGLKWIDPKDEVAPRGVKIALRTIGNIQTIGFWDNDGRYTAWQRLFKRDKQHERMLDQKEDQKFVTNAPIRKSRKI